MQSGGNRVSEEDQSYATNSLENLQVTVTNEERKILGVCWNHQSDQLIFNIHYVLKEARELKGLWYLLPLGFTTL